METQSAAAPQEPRLAYGIDDAAHAGDVGRSTIYEEIASGRLVARKIGRRTVILAVDLNEWINNLPKMKADHASAA